VPDENDGTRGCFQPDKNGLRFDKTRFCIYTIRMKTKKQTTLEYAIIAIRNYILDNGLQVGDTLPTELELAQSLGVSRNILREATRHYRTLGIIKSKTRTGAVIARLMPENPFSDFMPFFAASAEILPKLIEVRVLLEVGAAEFITVNITAKQLDELETICRKREESDDEEERVELDRHFHVAMLKGANNPLLDSLIPLVTDFFFRYKNLNIRLRDVNPRVEANFDHRQIIEDIRRGDAVTLAQRLRDHNQVYFETFGGKQEPEAGKSEKNETPGEF